MFNNCANYTGTADNGVNWLADVEMLPKKIPNARIFVWGYDADTHRKDYLSEAYLHQHGSQLVGELSDERRLDGTDKRPIIFIGHSLGGIVIKSVRETDTVFVTYSSRSGSHSLIRSKFKSPSKAPSYQSIHIRYHVYGNSAFWGQRSQPWTTSR